MKRLFIHTATRVIKRATIDDEVQPAPDETAVEFSGDLDLRQGGKFWKLDAQNNPVEATDADIDASDVDHVRVGNKRKAIVTDIETLMQDMADNGVTLNKMQQLFKKQLKLRK
jgi:hypothetical protein